VNNGVVIGVSEGSATIVAMTANGKTASCHVQVSPKTYLPEKIELNLTNVSLIVGERITVAATITPGYATDKTVTWASSDSSVATVTDGIIVGMADGTAIITATTSNGTIDGSGTYIIIS
jgi:alpha-amylase